MEINDDDDGDGDGDDDDDDEDDGNDDDDNDDGNDDDDDVNTCCTSVLYFHLQNNSNVCKVSICTVYSTILNDMYNNSSTTNKSMVLSNL